MKKIVIWSAGFLLGTWLFGQEGTGPSLAGEWKLSYGPYGQSAPGTPAELRAKAGRRYRRPCRAMSSWISWLPERSATRKSAIKSTPGANSRAISGGIPGRSQPPRWLSVTGWRSSSRAWTVSARSGSTAGSSGNGQHADRSPVRHHGPVDPGRREYGSRPHRPGHSRSAEIHQRLDRLAEVLPRRAGRTSPRPCTCTAGISCRAVVSAGLWREVRLEIKKSTRLEQVYWMTDDVDVARRKRPMSFSTAAGLRPAAARRADAGGLPRAGRGNGLPEFFPTPGRRRPAAAGSRRYRLLVAQGLRRPGPVRGDGPDPGRKEDGPG